jgi:polysaccharide transporter, PST family
MKQLNTLRSGMDSILKSPTKKKLLSNFFSLAIIQGANYLIPLLILPYIVRIIGPEKFGLLTFAQTFVYYFTMVINYSFDYTATREISIHRDDKSRLSFIFSSVFYSKLILFGISTLTFLIIISIVEQFSKDSIVYVVSYLINIGFIFFPSWFFQGIEKLSKTALFNFFIKVIFALIVILSIKQEEDFLMYALSGSVAQILVGAAAFMYVMRHYGINLIRIPYSEIVDTFRGGLSIFFSNIAVSLYTTTNLIILGFYASETNYGYFSAALKIALVTQTLVVLPLGLTLFPHIAKTMQQSVPEGIKTLRKFLKWISLFTFLLAASIFLFAEELIILLFGNGFTPAVSYLKILAFMPFVSGLNNLVSVQGLLNLKKDKVYLAITMIIFVFSLILNLILVPVYEATGTALILISSESLMTIIASIYLFRITRHEK